MYPIQLPVSSLTQYIDVSTVVFGAAIEATVPQRPRMPSRRTLSHLYKIRA